MNSPQFQDLIENGEESRFRRFFIDWNEFWEQHGDMGPDGFVVPKQEYLELLFMRKPELPILKVRFPDGSERPYWNTFYQEVSYVHLEPQDLTEIDGITPDAAEQIVTIFNRAIDTMIRIRQTSISVNGRRTDPRCCPWPRADAAIWGRWTSTLNPRRSGSSTTRHWGSSTTTAPGWCGSTPSPTCTSKWASRTSSTSPVRGSTWIA